MSDLNPLAFKVAIQDKATKKLDDIESAFDRLKDKTITVKVEGLSDLQQLLSALQHQQVQDIGKNVGSAINEATKNLQKEAQDAIRTSLGNLAKDLVSIKEAIQHDNFTAFSTRITKCAEAVDTLDAAFKKFHVTIGQDEGMRNFMTGLGEVIRNVRQTMGMINGGMSNATVTPDAMSRSVKVAQHETERLNNDLTRAKRTIETFGDKGFNVAALERYKTALLDVRENLKLIEKNGGVHPISGLTATQYLSSEDASRVISLLKTELSYYNNISRELERITNLRASLSQILAANPNTSYRGDLNYAIAGLDLREGLLARQGARDAVQTLNSEAYHTQMQDAVNLISKVSAESRQSAKDNAHLVESMRRAGIAVSDLAAKFDKLEIAKIRANAVAAKVDTSAYDRAVERMERYRRILEYIAEKGGHDPSRITGSVGYHNAANDLNIQAAALKSLTSDANAAANAKARMNVQEQQLAQSLRSTTNEMRNQSQMLSDLKSLATQYLGVWGAQSFLNNIIKIGGQLESQRLSLTAILGQRSFANDLFEKVQDLALKSPFGVVQLDQYTKNLSAFGFQYHELFDMTKRLADIAAGTGTDFGRLALALGHVRSEMALTGYTLRQFSMANVPMLKMLAENLGVTTAEIRKMVREKKVSYEDVEKVLKDLTDEGGMFYNMQEVMSEAVSAKFKNLKDAMDIMYGQMAESVLGDMLKGIAATLTDVTKRWQTFGTVLLNTALIIGAYKLYMHLLNVGIRTNTINLLQNVAATKTLTAADIEQMLEKKLLTAQDIALALAEGRLTLEQAKGALIAAGYTEAIIAEIAATNGLSAAMTGLKASSAGMLAMLTNPWTAALLAVEAVIGAVMAYKTWSDNIQDDVNRVLERAKTASQEIGKYLREADKEGKPVKERDLSTEIEQMKTILENSELYTEELQEQIGLAPSLSAEYDVLIKKMKEANANLEKMGVNADAIAEAIKASSTGDMEADSWFRGFWMGTPSRMLFNDDINQNTGDLEKSLGQYQRIVSTLDEYKEAMESAMKSTIEFYGHTELANLPLSEQLRLLSQDEEAWTYFVRTVDNGSGKFVEVAKTLKDAAEDVSDDWNEIVSDDVPRMMEKMAALFGKTPDQFREWAKTHNTIFQNMLDTMISAVNIASPKIAAALKNAILGWLDGVSDINLEETVETEAEKEARLRREALIKRNNTIKGYGNIGKHAMKTLVDYAKAHGKGDKNGNGLFDINFVGDYFKRDASTNEGLEAIAKDYKKYKGLIESARKSGNKAEEAEYQRRFNQLDVAMDAFGLDKTKGGKKTGKGTDENAKKLRERVRILKEAADSYKYWREKVGDEGAETHVESEFGKLLSEQGFKFENIEKFRETLAELRKEYEKKPKSKAMLEALKELDKEVAKLDRNDFEKHSEDYLSKMKAELDSLSKAWEIYKEVRDTTGDDNLAELLSGRDGLSDYRTLADAVQKKMIDDFSALGVKKALAFDVNLSDKQIEQEVFAAVPRETNESVENYEERIKGLIELYKKWRDLQWAVIKADASSFSGLIGLTQSYDAQIKKINDKLRQQKESNNALVGKTDGSGQIVTQAMADHANDIAETSADWEKMQLSAQYANLYNNAVAMSRQEFEQATTAVEKMIERLKELGLLSPEKAVQEQQKLQKARNEYGTTGFLGEKGAVGQFISGGYEGLMGYYAKRRDKAQETANRSEKGSQEQKDAQQEAEHYGKLFQNMSKLSDSAKDVVTAFSTLQSGLDLVTNLFDSMGNEGVANAVGDAAGVLGGAMQGAQSLSALGPWGMAAGAGLGLVSGLFAVHDKALQREIERLREDVQKIENNTSLILQARERTLGFDTGDLRRSYMDQYAPDQNRANALQKYGWLLPSYLRQGFNSEAQRAMYEYYKTNSTGTGYQQQYQNLLKERQDYMDMYNAEQDKKKSSGEALEEYRKKIAELDDEIRYFTLDLAKQLFDIDIKGWADQLSDALSSAFENGESAAKAYKDTVTNILQQVMNKMMQVAILEPMFQSLQDKLFGNSEKNIKGVFDASNPQKSMNAVIATITSFFGKGGEGEQTVTAALEFMNAFERGLNNAGLSVLNSDTANTLSSGVQGTSEETSALLAGYVNALRQDVAIKRILMNQFVTELWPEYVEQVASIVTSLKGIDNNVALIRALLSENGAIYVMIDSMKSHLDNITNGNEQVSVK